MKTCTLTKKNKRTRKINCFPIIYLSIIVIISFCYVDRGNTTQLIADADIQYWIQPSSGVTLIWLSPYGAPSTNDVQAYVSSVGGYQSSYDIFASFFKISGTGNITITADYTLSNTIISYTPDEPAFNSFTEVDLNGDRDYLSLSPTVPYNTTKSNTFLTTLSVSDGQEYVFQVYAHSAAYVGVPEPATMLLLGLGLIGLAGVKRKLRN